MVTSGRRPRLVSLGRQQCPSVPVPRNECCNQTEMRKERSGAERRGFGAYSMTLLAVAGRGQTDGRRDACPIYCLGRLGMGRRNCARAHTYSIAIERRRRRVAARVVAV